MFIIQYSGEKIITIGKLIKDDFQTSERTKIIFKQKIGPNTVRVQPRKINCGSHQIAFFLNYL